MAMTAAEKRQAITAANRGAVLLDQFVPGWINKANTKSLRMDDTEACILGQSFGDFSSGAKELADKALRETLKGTGLKITNSNAWGDDPFEGFVIDVTHYGFNTPDEFTGDNEDEYFSILTETWGELVDDRRAAKKRSRAAKKAAATRRQNLRRTSR